MRLIFVVLVFCPVFSLSAWAQNGKKDCSSNCFETTITRSEKISEACTQYELTVTHNGGCRYDLSHFTVAIPCGEVNNISNSKNWAIETGTDPTSGLTGFKVDNINAFGKTPGESFTVTFTVCKTTSCSDQLNCWQPVVAYKAATCVHYETITQSCKKLSASLTKTDATCFGSSTGSLTAIVAEGTEPYTFLWSNGATTASIQNISAGTYSVTITDATGETLTLSDSIDQLEEIQLAGTIINPSCNGIANGAIDLDITGGASPYSIQWSNNAITSELTSLSAGTYSVTVTDTKGCVKQKSFTLTNATQISISGNITQPTCNRANGAINLTVNGNSAPYTYSWSNGATTEDISNIAAGTYRVTVTDANGCKNESTFIVRENNTLRISYSVTPTSCLDDANGAIDLTISGGTQPYSYTWTHGTTLEDLSGLTAGIYRITVTDANGCTVTTAINVPKKTINVTTQITQPKCHGDETGSIVITPTDGVAPYTYSWNTGDSGNSLSGLAPGTYTTTITDATGCSRTLSYTIANPPALTVSASVSNSNCGESFTIDLSVNGGKYPYQYAWSSGETTQDITVTTPDTYTVTITDANGCIITKEVTVAPVENSVACTIQAPSTNPICSTTNNQLTAASVEGATYSWSVNSSDGEWIITSGSATATAIYTSGTINSTATFTLTVTKDGCTQTCSYTVATCIEDASGEDPGNGGEDPGDGGSGEEPGAGNETCDTCFESSIEEVSSNGSCTTYTVTVSTNGNCKHDLSHWNIAIPCGSVSNYSNSGGWPMEFGKDPTTGIYGLKVDNINNFGDQEDSFTVTFTLCDENCTDYKPVVAYKAGLCVAYDTLNTENTATAFEMKVYPNPFVDQLHFTWQADKNEYVAVELIDQYGNKLADIYNGYIEKGKSYTFDWRNYDLSGTIYYYRYRSASKTLHGKLLRAQ